MPINIDDFCKNFENKLLQLNSSRSGPVWIDLPVDIQWSKIDFKRILKPKIKKKNIIINKKKKNEFIRLIKESSKPLILIGSGIKLSDSVKRFKEFYKINKIPLVSTWNASDILDNNDQLYIGRPGIFGQRGANYIIQKCDLLICLGTGLGAGITTYNFKDFGRNAKKIFINNDFNELNSSRFKINLKWNVDIKILLENFAGKKILFLDKKWKIEAKKIKKMNFYEFKRNLDLNSITDPYFFCDQISKINKNKKTIFCVDGGGIITQVAPQMLNLSNKHKLNISAGLCTMGCLPEALGAKIAREDYEVVFLTGDGSLMMNLQELQTIKHYKKNIKIFVLSNSTYGLMMMAQKAFFNKNYLGSSNSSGVSFSDLKKISDVFDFDYFKILNNKDLLKKLPRILKNKKRLICEMIISKEFKMNPAFSTRVINGKKIQATLDSMEPYLNEREII
jgi:acetolactate synthase-1/2/3 large subunit